MRAAIYARYSTALQSASSIDDQVRLCRKLLQEQGWTESAIYSDAAISGASTLRPGYQEMHAAIRSGAFEILVTEALDRLSRDQEDIAGLYKQLTFAGIRLVTRTEGEINELHVGLKGTMNALYIKDLAEKTRRGLEGRVRQGRSGGGNAYGYDVVRKVDTNGEPIRGEREINKSEAAIVNRIFEAFAAGSSPREIARKLNEEGIAGPRGHPWRDTTIRGHHTRRTGILRNDLYDGRLVWNKQHYVKDPRTGKRLARPNPQDQWIVEDVPHLRIIDEALWQRVQDRLTSIRHSEGVTKARATKFWEHRRAKHLLSGLAHCGVCGGKMIAAGKDYLSCDRARNQGNCRNRKGIRRGQIEEVVLDALKRNLMQPDLVQEFISAFHEELNQVQREQSIGLEQVRKELARIDRQLDGLYEAIADGLRTPGLKAKLESLEQNKTALEANLEAAPPPAPILHPNLAELYRRKVEELHTSLNHENCRTEAAEILRDLIERIEIARGENGIEVSLTGAIVNMVKLAQSSGDGGKRLASAPAVPDMYHSSVKVVAGVGFEPTTFRL